MRKIKRILFLCIIALLLFTACTAPVNLSGDFKPEELAVILLTEPHDAIKHLGIGPADLKDGTINENGYNYLNKPVKVFNDTFNMCFESYNGRVERITLFIEKSNPTETDKKIYADLFDAMVNEYGNTTTDKSDGRQLDLNPEYYADDTPSVYEQWEYDGNEILLVYSYIDNVMVINIVITPISS